MVKIAAIQTGGGSWDIAKNVERAVTQLREAVENGAKILCLPELFNLPYFCGTEDNKYFNLAETIPGPTTNVISQIAQETKTVIISPVFERVMNGEYYNSAAVIGPDGKVIGKYRKTHIPYINTKEITVKEKYYFKPGNLGFPVFDTPFGLRIGIQICYDRHFPEGQRILGLAGAELVFVPNCTWGFTQDVWEMQFRVMARTNLNYVCGINKVGMDADDPEGKQYYGTTLIADPKGQVISKAGGQKEEIVYADIDLQMLTEERIRWPVYRDRRPEFYGPLVEL